MDLEISTLTLLFPAVSLFFIFYTNCFLYLAALVRKFRGDWLQDQRQGVQEQISNLRTRLILIRWMQLLGPVSLMRKAPFSLWW